MPSGKIASPCVSRSEGSAGPRLQKATSPPARETSAKESEWAKKPVVVTNLVTFEEWAPPGQRKDKAIVDGARKKKGQPKAKAKAKAKAEAEAEGKGKADGKGKGKGKSRCNTGTSSKAKSNCSSAESSESVTDSDAETTQLPGTAFDDDTTLATLLAQKPIKRKKKAGPEEREDIASALQATFVTDRVRKVTKKDMSEEHISVPLVPPPLWLSKVVGHMGQKLAAQEPLEIVINTWSDCAKGSVMAWQLACNVQKQ